jgi:4-alpha-glucanotransferase
MSLPQIKFEYAASYEDSLHRAAAEWGIEREFYDIFGKHHIASADTEAKILASLGLAVSSKEEVDNARRRRFLEQVAVPLKKTAVISENAKQVELSLPLIDKPELRLEMALEGGTIVDLACSLAQMTPVRSLELDGQTWVVHRLHLPSEIPLGYHNLRLSMNGEHSAESRVIVCPDRAYLPERIRHGGRTAGFAVTLWGLRSGRNWGCGDFSDLHGLIDWVVDELGGSFIALNPLHVIHNRFPYNSSPYLPLSIFYKNFIYTDIERVPEYKDCLTARRAFASSAVQQEIAELRAAEYVEYERVSHLKKRFLKALYRQFRHAARQDSARAQAFSEYIEREGEPLERLALYCALDEILHKQDRNRWTWLHWPAEYHDSNSGASRRFAEEHRLTLDFYKYIQFVTEEQLAAEQDYSKQRRMEIGLYHDLALATDSCGSDLWAYRNFYVTGCRVGSPPDAFSPKGQDWAFPPPNTIAHRENGYKLFRDSIQKIVRHGGALRIDHVMRLFRLFWIPDGVEAENGVYVKDNVIDLLHVLALESVRSKNIIIGEDLGTVTDEMRETLARFGILSYRLLYFEKRHDESFKRSGEYPAQSLVASTTHDLPTIAGFWTGRDIEARRAAGLADEHGYHSQLEDRRREKQRMLDLLHAEGLVPGSYSRNAAEIPDLDGTLHSAVIGFLAQTPSALLLLNQEDLTKETEQQNLPGSTAQYPNWRRKMKWEVEELSSKASDYTAMLRHHLDRTDRRA